MNKLGTKRFQDLRVFTAGRERPMTLRTAHLFAQHVLGDTHLGLARRALAWFGHGDLAWESDLPRRASWGIDRDGKKRVLACVTHGVFAPGTMERLDASPIERIYMSDSVETQPVTLSSKVHVISVAPLLAEAIRRIHHRQSISELLVSKP